MDQEAEQFVIKECLAWGKPLPEKIRNAPELDPSLRIYSRAFKQLSSCRQLGMGIGPIPWTAVVEYAKIYQLSQEQTDALHFHVERMDGAYLDWVNKKTTNK